MPYGTVSYVPSAAIICRRTVLKDVGGFDETLRSGEDVDLCWRLVEAGARLRYEPIALVAHDHRTQLREWFARKAFYGESAAPLSVRHPGKTAPLVISGWTLLVWMLMAMGSGIGYLASVVVAAITGRRIAKSLAAVEPNPRKWPWWPRTGCGRRRCNWRRRSAGTTGRSRWSPPCCSGGAGRWCWWPPSSTAWWTGQPQRQRRRRHQTGRAVHLHPAQAARRHRLRHRTVDGCGARASCRRAQAADPDLKPPAHLLRAATC